MQSMLLAAGLGTRLRPYTLLRPKPLFPVLNRPLLFILLDMLQQAGCTRTIVNGHHLGHLVEQAVMPLDGVSFQDEPEILGTGGSLRRALGEFSGEPVLVMNGDIFHAVDLRGLYDRHIRSGNRVTMAMHDYRRFNSVHVQDGRVVSFNPSQNVLEKELLAFSGIHVVEPDVLKKIPCGQFYHIIDLYEYLAGLGEKVGIVRIDGSYWRDIGTPEDYLQLHGDLLSGELGDIFPLPDLQGKWLVSSGADMADDVELSGWGSIGNAVIGRNVSLRNCVVWDGARLEDDTRLENAIVTGHLPGS
jgi:mannose-1-phosphate guanylyltransferase